mmetsp:Transcript_19962/g.48141  ORF Transcript_19962/g.48141 Transcript_19962/m.48141 type:complete len:202 (+) Transcript_19962:2069-2674(+)
MDRQHSRRVPVGESVVSRALWHNLLPGCRRLLQHCHGLQGADLPGCQGRGPQVGELGSVECALWQGCPCYGGPGGKGDCPSRQAVPDQDHLGGGARRHDHVGHFLLFRGRTHAGESRGGRQSGVGSHQRVPRLRRLYHQPHHLQEPAPRSLPRAGYSRQRHCARRRQAWSRVRQYHDGLGRRWPLAEHGWHHAHLHADCAR